MFDGQLFVLLLYDMKYCSSLREAKEEKEKLIYMKEDYIKFTEEWNTEWIRHFSCTRYLLSILD